MKWLGFLLYKITLFLKISGFDLNELLKRVFVVCLISSAFLAILHNTASAKERYFSTSELKQELKTILNHHDLKSASTGLSVVSIKSGKTLFSFQAAKPLKPASNMKLLTTASALISMGPDFRYETCVYKTGDLSDKGKLNGNIILKGSGDPNISGRFYDGNITAVPEMWVDAVEGIGINVVAGDIIADESIFDREYVCSSWPEDQLSKWYCAQVCGLSFNDNCINVAVVPGKRLNDPVRVILDPQTDYVKIINSCKTTDKKSKHLFSLFRKTGTNEIYLKGRFWKGSGRRTAWITVDNPSMFLATIFKELLVKRGIEAHGIVRMVDDRDSAVLENAEKIVCTVSTMRQVIDVANSRSQNLYAEHILKTSGANAGKQGSFSSGLNVIRDMISSTGHSPEEYVIIDGSGLSKKNRLTAEIITGLLCYMYKHKYGKVFMASLPVSGLKGTLKKRLKEPAYKARIKAKTGYISGASALSGYAETLSGELLAFSILVNDFKVDNWKIKKLQDSICKVLVNYRGE